MIHRPIPIIFPVQGADIKAVSYYLRYLYMNHPIMYVKYIMHF